jgi:hypothetical protein
MYCDGCDTEALNCKPITNLKEKYELSNFSKTSGFILHAVMCLRIRSHLASENIDKPLADFNKVNKKGGTPIKPSLARCEREIF